MTPPSISFKSHLLVEALVSIFLMTFVIASFIAAYQALERARDIYKMECLATLALDNSLERLLHDRQLSREDTKALIREECLREGLDESSGVVVSSSDLPDAIYFSLRSRKGTLLAEATLR